MNKTEVKTEARDEHLQEEFQIADLFCGAGGFSTGAKKAIEAMGGEIESVAINHWEIAVATHQANHPDVRHLVEDVSLVDPESVIKEGRLDLLMASPECKYHSRARGGKPIHDQGRMNPWVVMNWLTKLDIRTALVENVPEFVHWGPLGPDEKPDKSRRGEYFQGWFLTFQALGYQAEWRMLNAADYGDATTRTRFFLIARKDGISIEWPEPSHAKGDTGMFPGRLPWRGAREIIDWDNPGRSLPGRSQVPEEAAQREHPAENRPRAGEVRRTPGAPLHPAAGHTRPGHTRPGHTRPGHTRPGHTRPGHTRPGHTRPGHTRPGHTRPGHTRPGHTRPGHTRPGHTRPGHTRPGHTRPGHTRPGHTRPGHTRPGHTRPGHTRPGHTRPGHTRPGHTRPGHTRPGHTRPGHTRPGHTRPGHTRPGHTRPGHTRPGHTRPEHTRPRPAGPGHASSGPGNPGAGLRDQQARGKRQRPDPPHHGTSAHRHNTRSRVPDPNRDCGT